MNTTLPFLGHEAIYQDLEKMRSTARLPHALLFTGPEGIGKRLVALHLAKTLLCQGLAKPCGNCFSCRLGEIEKNPELWVLQPENGRIKIDAIRELKKALSIAPMTGDTRVVLVVDAHTMNAAAANALLKTLEEPPPRAYFILLTHALGWLPKTIVSRCQKIRFSPLPDSVMEQVAARRAAPPPLPFPLEKLFLGKENLNFADIHEQVGAVIEAETLPPFLDALWRETHRYLTGENPEPNLRFALLTFADKITAFQKSLRVNANPKIHLTRLLLHFQEPLETRL